MDCKTVKELLREYVDKELDIEKEMQVKEHLVECSDCRKELNTILSIENALKSLASKEAKPSFDFIRKIPEQIKQSFKVFFDKIYPQERVVTEFKIITIFDGNNPRYSKKRSYKEWYDRFEKEMLSKAFDLTQNEEEALNLYVDAYYQAMKYEHSYKPIFPFEGWFYTIMKNKWHEKVKKELPTLSLDSFYDDYAGLDFPDLEDIEKKIDREELIKIIRESVKELAPELRYPIISVYYYNMSYEEAAKEIEISLNEFKALMKKAKRVLEIKIKNKIV